MPNGNGFRSNGIEQIQQVDVSAENPDNFGYNNDPYSELSSDGYNFQSAPEEEQEHQQ